MIINDFPSQTSLYTPGVMNPKNPMKLAGRGARRHDAFAPPESPVGIPVGNARERMHGTPAWGRAMILPAVLGLGLALRLTGIDHGAPDRIFHPDVAKQALVGSQVYTGQFNPARTFKYELTHSLYPYGMSWGLGHAARFASRVTGKDYGRVHRFQWARRLRLLAVGIYLGAVLLWLYWMAALWPPLPLLATGWLLVCEPFTNQFNHYGMNDAPLVAMLLLGWAATARLSDARNLVSRATWAAMAGFCAGLGFGIKYQGILGLVLPAGVLGWQAMRHNRWRGGLLAGGIALAACMAGVWLATPLLQQEPRYFITHWFQFMRWQSNIMENPLPLPSKLGANAWAFIKLMGTHGGLLIVLLGAWGLILVRRNATSPRVPWISGLSMLLFLAVIMILGRDIVRANDLMPLRLGAIVLAGLGLATRPAVKSKRLSPYPIMATLTFLALGIFLWHSWGDSMALARPDTRLRARDWCRRHLPAHAIVLHERYTLPVDRTDVTSISCRYLASTRGIALARQYPEAWLIASSLAHDRFSDPGGPYFSADKAAFYRQLGNTKPVAAHFPGRRQMYFAHPEITIHQGGPHDEAFFKLQVDSLP